jgi:hypothetical protein
MLEGQVIHADVQYLVKRLKVRFQPIEKHKPIKNNVFPIAIKLKKNTIKKLRKY